MSYAIMIKYNEVTGIRDFIEDVDVEELRQAIVDNGLSVRKIASDVIKIAGWGWPQDRKWDFAPTYETDDESLLDLCDESVGVELNPEYCDMARQRIENEPTSLF